jgi:hypothetical protein
VFLSVTNQKICKSEFPSWIYYDWKKKNLVICLAGCAVVSVFGSGDYNRKKQIQLSVWRVVLLCQFSVLAITTGKKSYSHLSGGLCCCVSFWFWREIGSFFVVAGTFYYDRKKKVTVVCLVSCAVLSVFGFGGKLAVFLLWRESFITTGKKSSSRLSGGLCCCVNFWFWRLRPKKKKLKSTEWGGVLL